MYARVVRWDAHVEKIDQAEQIFQQVMSGADGQHGFQGGYLLADRQTGKSMSVTLWDSEDDMLRTEQSGWWQKQIDRFKAVMKSQPAREHYEVRFDNVQGKGLVEQHEEGLAAPPSF